MDGDDLYAGQDEFLREAGGRISESGSDDPGNLTRIGTDEVLNGGRLLNRTRTEKSVVQNEGW